MNELQMLQDDSTPKAARALNALKALDRLVSCAMVSGGNFTATAAQPILRFVHHAHALPNVLLFHNAKNTFAQCRNQTCHDRAILFLHSIKAGDRQEMQPGKKTSGCGAGRTRKVRTTENLTESYSFP